MPKIAEELFKQKDRYVNKLDLDFSLWRPQLQDIAELILPRRYVYLSTTTSSTAIQSGQQNLDVSRNHGLRRNSRILDPSGTVAARTLAHGLMNGITSPARPWFRLRLTFFGDDDGTYPKPILEWLEEVERRMHLIMAESNYYNAMAIMYLELVVFGTAVFLIYEDFEEVIRCYNSPCGEYRLAQDDRRVVVGFARSFQFTVQQAVAMFGLENVSAQTQAAFKRGGESLLERIDINHLIEKNDDDSLGVSRRFKYREMYWEAGRQKDGSLLRLSGYQEKPIIAPRWEITGNDTYGHSPTMDALPEIRSLQAETKQKLQALDKMIRPPIVADIALQAQPTALLPGGVSYVTSAASFGAKPVFTVNPPLDAMTNDILQLQQRIRTIYYNDLFRNVSQLDTVRSAAEIYERKSEDLVQLGSVLERFENEALDPSIKRIFNIMLRKELLPELPEELDLSSLDIQYVSILSDAQRAADVGSIERGAQFVGQLSAAAPQVLDVPDFDDMIRQYFNRLNLPATSVKAREEVEAKRAQDKELADAQQAALVGKDLTDAARNLSETNIGGASALDTLIGQ